MGFPCNPTAYREKSPTATSKHSSITVFGIDTLDGYGRVIRYLESLSILESVGTEALDGDALSVRVQSRGDAALLRRILALGSVLEPGAEPLTFSLIR